MPAISTPRQRAIGYATAAITDQVLDAFAATAERAQNGHTLDDAGAALLLAAAGPIARELQQRRRAAELIHDLSGPATVLMFPGGAE